MKSEHESLEPAHLLVELLLCVGLILPAVEVGGQEERLLLLPGQPGPPDLLLLQHLDVHLALGRLVEKLGPRGRGTRCIRKRLKIRS